jgi:predicted dehydrogenase
MGAEKLGVGMVGAGSMARHHLDAWRQSVETEVAAIWNRTRHKAEALADEYEIPAICAEVDELVHRADVDIVSVCTPHFLHHPISMAAIEAGKHVFCEKPLAMNYAEARQMWERAQMAGVKTGIQFGHRVHPWLVKARALLSQGYLGEVRYVEVKWCLDLTSDPAFPLVWRFKRDLAGAGALGDLGVYAIDAARWLVGEFMGISASMRTYIERRPIIAEGYNLRQVEQMAREGTLPPPEGMGAVENDDECVFCARFECGAQGMFRTSRLENDGGLRIGGSEGVLVWEGIGKGLLRRKRGVRAFTEIEVPDDPGAATMVTQFISNIRNDTDMSPTFYDGMKAQGVIDAAMQSAEKGCWVSLPLSP